MWMQEALDTLNRETNDTSISKLDVLDHLAYATSQVKRFVLFSLKLIFSSSKEISKHALAVTEEILAIGKKQKAEYFFF